MMMKGRNYNGWSHFDYLRPMAYQYLIGLLPTDYGSISGLSTS